MWLYQFADYLIMGIWNQDWEDKYIFNVDEDTYYFRKKIDGGFEVIRDESFIKFLIKILISF